MKILTVGGGSGGHVTPVVAVIKEIKKNNPNTEVRFWCDSVFYDRATSIMHSYDESINVSKISAGKFRRYNHLNFWQHLMIPSIVFPNIRDLFLIIAGFFQSFFKLIFWRPDVIFIKGGYVCLPVGVAAHLLRIPFVIHDSDAHPGLTNRILSKYATKIATGAPLKYYNYPKEKSYYVGIPVDDKFKPLTKKQQNEAKKRWGIDVSIPLVVVTGGGLGAKRINKAVVSAREGLEKVAHTVLVSGQDDYASLKESVKSSKKFTLYDFISKDMAGLLGAADVVVARAGATSLLELAALNKPTILIPNAKLTGGHQLKNAKVYEDANAVIILNEDKLENEPNLLVDAIKGILDSEKKAEQLSSNFAQFAKPEAAKDVADLVLAAGERNN